MKISNKRKTKSTIALTFLLLSSIMLIMMPYQSINAQPSPEQPTSGPLPSGATPAVTVTTQARISFRPTTIGLGQTFLVNIWTNPGIHIERFHPDYKITITKPDGDVNVITMNSYCADATAWFEYIGDQVGEWKLKFEFAGTYFPKGLYYQGVIYPDLDAIGPYTSGMFSGPTELDSAYYLPSSTPERTLVVQEEQVLSWPPSALPTDYWTRPISPENREWWTIAGGFPWYGPATSSVYEELYPDTNPIGGANYRFTPWVQAPNTAHIVWKEVGQTAAGLIGGDEGIDSYNAERSRAAAPNIILNGRAFQRYTKPGSGKTAVNYWKSYDIRTGELFWERPLEEGENVPTAICYEIANPAVPGTNFKSSQSASLVYIGGGYLLKYDPWTGALSLNCSIAPLTSSTYYINGYALGVQNLGGGNYRLINWTTLAGGNTLAPRIVTNTTYQRSSLPTFQDWNTCLGATVSNIQESAAFIGFTVNGYDLLTGEELWSNTVDEMYFSSRSGLADHGKFAIDTMNGYWLAWDLRTGNLAWKSEMMDYPWDASGWGAYGTESAYGLIYWSAYTAQYAFDWETGKIVWKFQYPSIPYETPYSGYVSFRGYPIVADGKIYPYNDEHSPTSPITRGWSLFCLNATTGEELWNITGSLRPYAVADGYLVGSSMYDGYLYVFGKGKSETTVTAPDVAVPKGTAMTIKGTILDMSPGQPETPCVSVESMSTQMMYLHMQRPIDGIWHNETITGVPVMLSAIGEDGSYVDLGTVTTDGYYGTFGLTWTPESEGMFKIIASFAGDDSYGSSDAATYVTVGPAPAAGGDIEPEPEPEPEPTPLISTELAIAIAVIAAIVIGIVAFVLLRRRE